MISSSFEALSYGNVRMHFSISESTIVVTILVMTEMLPPVNFWNFCQHQQRF